MRPSHPAASLRRAAAELADARLRGRDDHRPAARRSGAGRRRRARDRSPERRQVGTHGRRRIAACSRPPRCRRRRPSWPAAADSSCSERPKRTSTAATSTSCSRRSACASRTRRRSTSRRRRRCRPGCRRRRRPGCDDRALLHLVREVRLYRAGTLDADHAGAVVLQTGAAGRSARGRAARRRAVRRRPRRRRGRLRPLRRRLPARPRSPAAVAERGLLGGAAAFRSDRPSGSSPRRRQDPAWLRLRDETNALRAPGGAQGRGRPVEARRRRGARPRRRHGRRHRRAGAALPARAGLPRPGAASTCAPGSTADAASRTSRRRSTLFRPEQHRDRRHPAPRRLPHVHAQRLARHALRGADRRALRGRSSSTRSSASLRQRRSTCRCSWWTTPPATTASARCSSPRRSASPSGRPTTSAASSATGRPRASSRSTARGAEVLAHRPAARRAGARRRRRPGARDVHPLGHDPRPLAQPRRPALRPVHDPPAPAVLDVLARGAARGPGDLRHGRGAGAPGLPVRALRAVRDPLRPHPALPHHRATACATTTAWAASCCSPICTAPVWCSGPTTAAHRLGPGGGRRRRAARAGGGAVPARHRHEQGVVLDRRARPRGRVRPRRTWPRSGPARAACTRTRRTRGRGSTACWTTSSR